jgi:hypothetical protein
MAYKGANFFVPFCGKIRFFFRNMPFIHRQSDTAMAPVSAVHNAGRLRLRLEHCSEKVTPPTHSETRDAKSTAPPPRLPPTQSSFICHIFAASAATVVLFCPWLKSVSTLFEADVRDIGKRNTAQFILLRPQKVRRWMAACLSGSTCTVLL